MAVAEEIAFRSTESPVDPGRHKSNADSSILQLQFKVWGTEWWGNETKCSIEFSCCWTTQRNWDDRSCANGHERKGKRGQLINWSILTQTNLNSSSLAKLLAVSNSEHLIVATKVVIFFSFTAEKSYFWSRPIKIGPSQLDRRSQPGLIQRLEGGARITILLCTWANGGK